jgi:hypothetical protein
MRGMHLQAAQTARRTVPRARLRFEPLVLAGGCAVAAFGCTGQSGTEIKKPACLDGRSVLIAAHETTEVGSADNLARHTAPAQEGSINWYAHEANGMVTTHTTRMTLEVQGDASTARRIETECGAALALEAQLRLTSSDGAFQDRFPGTLRAETSGEIRFSGAIPAHDLAGNYDASRITRLYRGPYVKVMAFLNSGSGSIFIEDATAAASPGNSTLVSASVADWSAGSPLHDWLAAGDAGL